MKWIYLLVAIITEVIATSALKESEGFSKVLPSLIVIIGYSLTFYFMSLVLKELSVGITYAIWSGMGILGRYPISLLPNGTIGLATKICL